MARLPLNLIFICTLKKNHLYLKEWMRVGESNGLLSAPPVHLTTAGVYIQLSRLLVVCEAPWEKHFQVRSLHIKEITEYPLEPIKFKRLLVKS